MAELVSFPDDEMKRHRRARAALGWSAGTVDGYLQLCDGLSRDFPRAGSHREARLLAWSRRCVALMEEVKRRPAGLRADVHLLDRLLKLKGLVSEAEAESLAGMAAPDGGSCLGDARAENEALAERLIGLAREDAKRTPCASLTPGLVSHDLAPRGGWRLFEAPLLDEARAGAYPAHGAAGPVPPFREAGADALRTSGSAAAFLARLRGAFRHLAARLLPGFLTDPLATLFHDRPSRPVTPASETPNSGFTMATLAPPRPRVTRKAREDFHAGPLGTPYDGGAA